MRLRLVKVRSIVATVEAGPSGRVGRSILWLGDGVLHGRHMAVPALIVTPKRHESEGRLHERGDQTGTRLDLSLVKSG